MSLRRPIDEAAAWFGRLRAPDVSNDERAEFAAWLAADPRHQREFDTFLELWEHLGPVARGAAQPLPQPRHRYRVSLGYRVPLAMAASALLATMLWLMLPGGERHLTEHGEIAQFQLRDGSELHLNTDSAARVLFDAESREVRLERGELFIEVEPDPTRPLSVITAHGSATAVGTAFAVRDTGSATLVTVTEGLVRVSAADGAARDVAPGEQARLAMSGIEAHPADAAGTARWRTGELVYDGVPLADLIADLNRYLPTRMTIADPELATIRVSAVLVLGEQSEMLEALTRSLPLRWSAVSDRLIIIQRAS